MFTRSIPFLLPLAHIALTGLYNCISNKTKWLWRYFEVCLKYERISLREVFERKSYKRELKENWKKAENALILSQKWRSKSPLNWRSDGNWNPSSSCICVCLLNEWYVYWIQFSRIHLSNLGNCCWEICHSVSSLF